MSTTGQLLPTAVVTAAEDPWLDNDWVSPANIYGAGEASVTAATFDAGDQTYVLKAYTFDLSVIPDGSTIDGVIVTVNGRYATAPGSIDLVQLLDTSRAKVGDNRAATPQALTTSAADYTFGNSTDKWNNALTAAWVKDPDFGVAVGMLAGGTGNNNVDVYCDYIKIEVYYTAPTIVEETSSPGSRSLSVSLLHQLEAPGDTTQSRTLGIINILHELQAENPLGLSKQNALELISSLDPVLHEIGLSSSQAIEIVETLVQEESVFLSLSHVIQILNDLATEGQVSLSLTSDLSILEDIQQAGGSTIEEAASLIYTLGLLIAGGIVIEERLYSEH